MKISIGNDHAGPDYKKAIVQYLESKGHQVTNYGTDTDASVDYPDFGHPVATDVSEGKADFGIVSATAMQRRPHLACKNGHRPGPQVNQYL